MTRATTWNIAGPPSHVSLQRTTAWNVNQDVVITRVSLTRIVRWNVFSDIMFPGTDVIVDGVEYPVVNAWVVVDGMKRQVVNAWVIVGGVKYPVVNYPEPDIVEEIHITSGPPPPDANTIGYFYLQTGS